MTGIEKSILASIIGLLALVVLFAWILMNAVEAEFGDCVGLKGSIEHIWEGSPCTTETDDTSIRKGETDG